MEKNGSGPNFRTTKVKKSEIRNKRRGCLKSIFESAFLNYMEKSNNIS